jgi:serine/threonine protein kinase
MTGWCRLARSSEDVDDVRREVQIMHHLKGHDNIVTLIAAYEDRSSIHLVRACSSWICISSHPMSGASGILQHLADR